MNLKSVYALCALFLHVGYQGVASTILMDEGYCEFSDEEEDRCSAYCYKSVRPPLEYIMELKEQLKLSAECDQVVEKLASQLADEVDNGKGTCRDFTQILKSNTEKIDNIIAGQKQIENLLNNLLTDKNQMVETIINQIDKRMNSKADLETLEKKLNKERENYDGLVKEITKKES